jgi:hypothetical protein
MAWHGMAWQALFRVTIHGGRAGRQAGSGGDTTMCEHVWVPWVWFNLFSFCFSTWWVGYQGGGQGGLLMLFFLSSFLRFCSFFFFFTAFVSFLPFCFGKEGREVGIYSTCVLLQQG